MWEVGLIDELLNSLEYFKEGKEKSVWWWNTEDDGFFR